jgi:hypothetical protein
MRVVRGPSIGLRLDVLRAAISGVDVRLIAVCVDDQLSASRIVELTRAEFPN